MGNIVMGSPEAEAIRREPSLLPCPFCGKDVYLYSIIRNPAWHCYCGNCETHGPEAITRDGAIEAWNDRKGVEVA